MEQGFELIGQFLDHYELRELIGEGGFAYVYKAWDHSLQVWVAVKVLKSIYARDPAFERSFIEEARIAAKLHHPNIIPIKSVGRSEGLVYFVMDYIPRSVREMLKTGRLSPEKTIKYSMDVAKALGYAHRLKMVHRDIKPDNILVDADDNAIVTDFGIARAANRYSRVTGTMMIIGTAEYMSPEQLRGKPVDHRSDIYSLGCSMYEMVTGKVPFTGTDWYDIGRKHIEEPPIPPSKLNAKIPLSLEAIILRAMAKDPEDRFESAQELYGALDEVKNEKASRQQVPLRIPFEKLRLKEKEDVGSERIKKGGKRNYLMAAFLFSAALIAVIAGVKVFSHRPVTSISGGGGSISEEIDEFTRSKTTEKGVNPHVPAHPGPSTPQKYGTLILRRPAGASCEITGSGGFQKLMQLSGTLDTLEVPPGTFRVKIMNRFGYWDSTVVIKAGAKVLIDKPSLASPPRTLAEKKPDQGYLSVSDYDPNGEVWVDGKFMGKISDSPFAVDKGKHDIKVRWDNETIYTSSVTVRSKDTSRIRFGRVIVKTNVDGADVYVVKGGRREKVGKAYRNKDLVINHLRGYVSVIVSKPGYSSYSKRLRFSKGESRKVYALLEQATGRLSFNSDPFAYFYIDDDPQRWEPPIVVEGVPVGKHRIRIVSPSGELLHDTIVTVKKDDTTPVPYSPGK